MYPYIVHVERKDIASWDIQVPNPVRGRPDLVRYHNSYSAKVDANIENGNYHTMETWYCRDRASADALAALFASELPGRNILVLKLETVTSCAAAPATVSVYSEKGLLPT